MPRAIVPLAGAPQQRSTGVTDQRYVNVTFETITDPAKDNKTIFCVKRPGLANFTQPPAGAAAGRGLYAWGATAKIYSVFANKIFSNTTDLGVTLAASSGRVWTAETPQDFSAQMIIWSDGTDNYNITTADAIVQIDETDDPDYPTPNLGSIVFIDGYVISGQSNGRIWNTDPNSAVSWRDTNFLTADTHGGDLVAVHIQRDQVLGFTTNRVEFYYNNGNPFGSPFLRVDQNTLYFGLAHRNTLAWAGDTVCFVAQNPSDGDGSRTVFMIVIGKAMEIGSTVINRFLAAEGTNIATASAWMERVNGEVVYVLNLDSAERTFVYHVSTGTWTEWNDSAGTGKFNGIFSTTLNGTVYLQDISNGRVYTFLPTTFQDSGSNFTVLCQTEARALNEGKPFRITNCELLADTQTSGSTSLLLSGDDYATFTTIGSFDNTAQRKRVPAGGYFYNTVAARLTFAGNTAWRAQAVAFDWEPA